MRRSKRFGFGLGLAASFVAAVPLVFAGCGGEPHAGDSHAVPETAAPPPPTPDTTPIEALRTPAGLILKIGSAETPIPSAEAPASAPAPTPSPAASP